jgi:hypothetical protein
LEWVTCHRFGLRRPVAAILRITVALIVQALVMQSIKDFEAEIISHERYRENDGVTTHISTASGSDRPKTQL